VYKNYTFFHPANNPSYGKCLDPNQIARHRTMLITIKFSIHLIQINSYQIPQIKNNKKSLPLT